MAEPRDVAEADCRAVVVLAALAFAAGRNCGARIKAADIQTLQASSLGPLMRACGEWGQSPSSDGQAPPDLTYLAALRSPGLDRDGERMRAELRPDKNAPEQAGKLPILDEAVCTGACSVHAEMLSDRELWVGIDGPDGRHVRLIASVEGRARRPVLVLRGEDEGCPEAEAEASIRALAHEEKAGC